MENTTAARMPAQAGKSRYVVDNVARLPILAKSWYKTTTACGFLPRRTNREPYCRKTDRPHHGLIHVEGGEHHKKPIWRGILPKPR